MGYKAVFFDRDGTINSDEGHYYIYRVEDFKFNAKVIHNIKRLYDSGFMIFVVTNQGGVAKGKYSCSDVESVNSYMRSVLKSFDVEITKIYYCPHHESISVCECRKPSPFFINKAIEDYHLDREYCYMIGDSDRDIESAERANISSFKIDKNSDFTDIIDGIIAKCSKK